MLKEYLFWYFLIFNGGGEATQTANIKCKAFDEGNQDYVQQLVITP